VIRLLFWLRKDGAIEFLGSQSLRPGYSAELGGELRPNDGQSIGGLCYADLRAYLDRSGEASPVVEIVGGQIIPQPSDDEEPSDAEATTPAQSHSAGRRAVS